jgi:Flp pilus assembly protein TadD
MINQVEPGRCPDERVKAIAATFADTGGADLDNALLEWPRDPRLHFLKGSLLAARQDFAGAQVAMRRAVDLAPDFAVARFQLGLLLLTCGEPYAAQEALGPLHALPPDHYLHLFASGLSSLVRDDFEQASELLLRGMSRNHDNPAMNRDMQLIVDQLRTKMEAGVGTGPGSPVDQLLQQAALKASKR